MICCDSGVKAQVSRAEIGAPHRREVLRIELWVEVKTCEALNLKISPHPVSGHPQPPSLWFVVIPFFFGGTPPNHFLGCVHVATRCGRLSGCFEIA